MKNLTPYLMFNGDCEEALNFYKECLGGEIGYMGRYGDTPMGTPESQKDKIMHAYFTFWGGGVMASDHVKEAGYTTEGQGANVHLSLGFDEIAEMEATFDKMKRGGTVTMDLQDQFWGDRFGMLKDKHGIHWMFSCTVKKEE
ncbi:MAG: PhnB protein [Acidobacteriota bacterium]|jgi:PhnB protein|nr:PhnB protein [Acidobacteriota bacterium]